MHRRGGAVRTQDIASNNANIWAMKHGCVSGLRCGCGCGCGCGTLQFLKKVGAGAAGLGNQKIIKNIFNILLSILFHII